MNEKGTEWKEKNEMNEKVLAGTLKNLKKPDIAILRSMPI